MGIPTAELEKVFEPFYRVDKSRTRQTGGFGLGLSLCKRIVQAHGGTIRAGKAAGGGASIIFTLPLGTPPAMPDMDESGANIGTHPS